MKKSFLNYFTIGVLMTLIACSGKQESTETTEAATAEESDEWPMMDEFHMIMAESFHPYKDSANLDPAKANAAEMAALAEKWSNSALPKKVDNESVKSNLQTLKSETAAFAELVKQGDDAAIGDALKDLHDLFHDLQDAWYKGNGEGHKHQHNH